MKRPDLPVYYYHDHFVEMLSFVRTTYGSILTDEHDAFVLRFQSLSKDAQCLLIRMVNRRGAIFNRTLFRYAEISDVERAADDLAGVRPSQNPQGGGLRFASSRACPRTSWSAVRRRRGGRISASPGRKRSWSITSSPTFRSRSLPSIAGRRSSSRWMTSVRSSSCCICTSARPSRT